MTYNTGKREKILAYLKENKDNSYSLEQICSAVTDGTGKSTVYRLVSSLVGEGIVRRLAESNSRHVSYQFVGDGHCSEHLHLKCLECGKLIHLDKEASFAVGQALGGKDNFTIDTTALLYGRCGGCNKEGGAH